MADTIPHYDRIRSLVILLENLPRIQEQGLVPQGGFDMHLWANEKPGCGTAACALGWAGLHPSFRERGLVTNLRSDTVRYERVRGLDAAAAFFGIHRDVASIWFMFCSYESPRVGREDVAWRIRSWLAERGELGCLA